VKHTTLGGGVALVGLFAGVLACAPQQGTDQPTTPTAEVFLDDVNAQLKGLGKQMGAAGWVRSTYITEDTGVLAARASEDYLKFHSEAVAGSRAYSGQGLDSRTTRDLMQLKLGTSMPAPDDAAKRKQLAETAVRLGGLYGASKYCDDSGKCQGLDTLEPILADPKSGYDELLEAWTGWRTISPPMREDYQQFVALANETDFFQTQTSHSSPRSFSDEYFAKSTVDVAEHVEDRPQTGHLTEDTLQNLNG
jgi:peptidyl-dipeptidase A